MTHPEDDGEVVAIREHTLCGDQQGRFLGTPLEPRTTDDGEVVAIRSYPFVVMSKSRLVTCGFDPSRG